MKPQIFAKSALKLAEIQSKLDIGCDGIEIQLLDELIQYKDIPVNKIFDLGKFKDCNIKAVHAPLISGMDINIEYIGTYRKVFESVMYIANYFGQISGRKMIVIIHSEQSLESLKLTGLIKTIQDYIKIWLHTYPYIDIAIENVSPVRGFNKDHIYFANNIKYDNVELAKYLRDYTSSDRVGTVVDTCHAEMAAMTRNALQNRYPDLPKEDYSMNEFFAINKDVIKLIHMSYTIESGMGKGRHGMPFFKGSEEKIKEYLDLYEKYGYTCPVTLEVAEVDYLTSEGFRISKEKVDKYFKIS